MLLKDYHCHTFELDCLIPRKAFNREAFLADIHDISPMESNNYGWAFGSRDNPGKQHADMMVRFNEDSVHVLVVYHVTGRTPTDERPPYMEDCANWLSGFVDASDVTVQQIVLYLFEHHSPVINLPFPLLSIMEGSLLEGAQVTGVAVRFAGKEEPRRITIDRHEDAVFISLCGQTKLDLRCFSVEAELDKLAPLVKTFVREVE